MNKQIRGSYLKTLIKLAGPNEKKRADSLNWNHIKKDIDPGNPNKQYSRDEIEQLLKNSQNLIIPKEQIAKIESLNLEPKIQSRIDKNSKSFLIIGSVVTSNSDNEINEKMDLINWFVEFAEVEKNGLGVSPEFTTLEQLKTNFNKFMEDVRRKKNEVDGARQTSKEIDYKTNEVVYQFSDGWRVVYLPAVGEMEEYPGLPGTSHDRILEGNKNGLCLGSGSKFYQDNSRGKVYSIRDPKNKPKATIRILNNRLDECKAKNNLTPDIETCLHLVEWFDLIEGLNYKNSQDYLSFPPLTIEAAKEKFSQEPESAYTKGWAGHWFGKGIPELDEDVKEKIRNNDILIIKSGMGKNPKYTEMVRPVVRYWCQEYLDGNAEYDILFGSWGDPPTHESYKTYKKDPIMQQAVVKLSQERVSWFIELDLSSVKEYRPLLTSKMIEDFIKDDYVRFLSHYIDKDWVTEENKIFAFKKVSEQDPRYFLVEYSEDSRIPEHIRSELIIKAAINMAEEDPNVFFGRIFQRPPDT